MKRGSATCVFASVLLAGCSFTREIVGADVHPPAARLSVGQVTTLDDEAFSPERVHDGMMDPVDTPKPVGFGIYLLQPYDPGKIPVLFVHGIAASPRDFRAAVESLDASRYQPWVMSYPTGLRLPVVSEVLAEQLLALRDRFHVPRVVVVAHSMGGLVARAAVLKLVREQQADFVERLVTISTPYGGEDAATLGARHAYGMVPAWSDLAPGSDFLRALETPLPRTLPFYLLFSYGTHGEERHFWQLVRWFGLASLSGSNDDAVTLASQLAPRAQTDATRMLGYDADHVSILSLPEALQGLAGVLAERPEPIARGQ